MPLPSVDQFAQILHNLRLLLPTQDAELANDKLQPFANSKTLAQELLRRGWLTPFQVNLLLQGRTRDLRLGHYVLLERLGEGGSGQVFKARHQAMNREVALKLIRSELMADPEVVQRFYREIQVISQLSHPNIVHAFDAGPVGPLHTLVMEYVEGADLARLVKQSGPLAVHQACDYVRQAALGLQHAHERGLIHRDVKPSNLILAARPGAGAGVVKLLDLGLARFQQRPAGELTGVQTPAGAITMGTPDYMAPEQALDFHQADIRADLYSLGCTLCYLLSGQPPFPGGSLAQKLLRHQGEPAPHLERLRPGAPPGVALVMARLLAKRPEDRYPTPGDVAAALAALADDSSRLTVTAHPPLVPPPLDLLDAATTETSSAFAAPKELTVTERLPAPGPARRSGVLLGVGGGGCVLAGLVFIAFLLSPPAPAPAPKSSAPVETTEALRPLAKLSKLKGDVQIRNGESSFPARIGLALQRGQGLQTTGPASEAGLTFEDQTSLELGPGTAVRDLFAGDGTTGKKVRIQSLGLLRGQVTPQPTGRPLLLAGELVDLKVAGGRFTLAGEPAGVCLRVDEGSVRLTRPHDGQAIEVRAGQFARVARTGPLTSKPLGQGVRVLDDFEAAKFGNWVPFVSDGGKTGSTFTRELVSPGKFGERAMKVDYKLALNIAGGVEYIMEPNQDWSRYEYLHFWFYGNHTGNPISLAIGDHLHAVQDKGALVYTLQDDVTGWREVLLPWSAFRKSKPGRTEPFDFSKIGRMSFILFSEKKGSFQLDQVQLLEHEILR